MSETTHPAGTAPVNTNVEVVAVDLSAGEAWKQETHNVTCKGGHESLLDLANPFGDGKEFAQLAIGTDGASGTAVGDRSLNNEIGRSRVRFGSRSNRVLSLRAFAPSQITDSSLVDEVGIALGSGSSTDLVNHATISGVDKSSPDTILIVTTDITIKDVSE